MQEIILEVEPPCFVYKMIEVEKQINKLQSEKLPTIDIFYAMKANPLESILNLVLEKGLGVETTSIGEMEKALSTGFTSHRMLLTGPGKTGQTLDYAIRNDIGFVIIESEREAQEVNRLVGKYAKKQPILLRISPKDMIPGQDLQEGFALFGGKPVKYGFDEESLLQVIPAIMRMPNIQLNGIHVFAASGVQDYHYLIEHVDKIFNLGQQIQNSSISVPVIDFGGGFGYAHDGSYEFDIGAYFSALGNLVKKYNFEDKHLFLELGTYIVAPSGNYITEIVDVKYSRGEYFIIVDGGIHHLLRPSLVSNHIIQVYDVNGEPIDDKAKTKVTVVGNLCYPLDILARDVEIRLDAKNLERLIGGRVAVFNCGAYGENFSARGFSMHNNPNIYTITTSGKLERHLR